MILVDSNIYIRISRQGLDPSEQLARDYKITDLATCGVVEAEVLRGLRFPKHRQRMANYFNLLQRLPTPSSLWDNVTELAWSMDRKGIVLPLTDLIIAACALRAHAAVLTCDSHFSNIPGLEVLEP